MNLQKEINQLGKEMNLKEEKSVRTGKWFQKWRDNMLLNTSSIKRIVVILEIQKRLVTNRPSDGQTDLQTDTRLYEDTMTHLKMLQKSMTV